MRGLIDSDVLIDYLQGVEKAKAELAQYERREISIVSWIEIMTGAENAEEEKACRQFLATFTIHHLSVEIADEAVRLRRQHRVRLPDAVIWATARIHGVLLVTRNARDFPTADAGVRIPYSVT